MDELEIEVSNPLDTELSEIEVSEIVDESRKSNEEAIETIIKAIEKSGFKPGEDLSICLDVAANELKESKTIDYYSELISKYPIKSIEDPFTEDDWESWKKLTKNTKIQIVGDDLFVTNVKRLKKGIEEKSANAILIKLNQGKRT